MLSYWNLSTTVWKGLAWGGVVLCGILLILIIWMTRSINSSIAIMKEASKVITRLPSLLLYVLNYHTFIVMSSWCLTCRIPVGSSIGIVILSFLLVLSSVYVLSSSLRMSNLTQYLPSYLQASSSKNLHLNHLLIDRRKYNLVLSFS